MAYAPGLFILYLIYHEIDSTKVDTGGEVEYQQMFRITFANRTLSDEWWRAGSKFLETLKLSSEPGAYEDRTTFQRISPQWYHFRGGEVPELNWFINEAWARPFKDKMFIMRMQEPHLVSPTGVGMVPQGPFSAMGLGSTQALTNGAEPISGNWYYIRSVATPYEYWHIDCGTEIIYASRQDRTRFRLDIVPTPTSPESNPDKPSSAGTVIIPSDAITLTTSRNGFVMQIIPREGRGKFIHHRYQTDTGVAMASWLFGDFVGSFGVLRDHYAYEGYFHPLIVTLAGEGEVWQLV